MTASKARAVRWWRRQDPSLTDLQLAIMFGVSPDEVCEVCSAGSEKPLSREVNVYSLALSAALRAGASDDQRRSARVVMGHMMNRVEHTAKSRRPHIVTSFGQLIRDALDERIVGRH